MTFLPRRTVPKALRSATAIVVMAFGLTAPLRTASAYCRTTTKGTPENYNPALGCFTEGLPLFWKNVCVGYSIQQNAAQGIPLDEATHLIDEAFATWNGATCSATGSPAGISASDLGPVTCDEVLYNQNGPNQNVIVFRDTWPYSDPNNTLGLTTVTFNSDTGEIYDADMEINASGANLSTTDVVPAHGFDLLSVVTHEAGHFFGLAHATDPKSTMYASYRPGTSTLRTLTADDIAGLCTIYPTKEERSVASSVGAGGVTAADACDSTPRHGFSTTCDANPAPVQDAPGGGGCAVAAISGDRRPFGATAALAVGVAAFLASRRRVRHANRRLASELRRRVR